LEWSQRLYTKAVGDEERAMITLVELYDASNCGAGTPEMIARAKSSVPALARSTRSWMSVVADAYTAVWSYDKDDPEATDATIRHVETCAERSRAFNGAVTGWV